MQVNFHQVGGQHLYLYYPVMLIGISVALLFNPFKVFYFRTRMWLLYSLVSFARPVIIAFINTLLVAVDPCWCVSRGMARLLHGRHVLLLDIQHECKAYEAFFLLLLHPTDFNRVLLCSFACIRTAGTTHLNATHLICASLVFFLRCLVYGGCCNVFADTGTLATSFPIC